MKTKLLIFDVDGTLVDSLGDHYETDKKIIENLQGVAPSLEEYMGILGRVTDWNKFYEQFGVSDSEKATALFYKLISERAPRAIPEAYELLSKVRRMNIPHCALSINENPYSVHKKLLGARLLDYFINSVYSDPKTKTEVIREVCKERGIDYNNAILIGDTEKDIREGKEVGVVTVGVSNKYSFSPEEDINKAQPNYLIHDIRDLEKIIK